MFENWDFLEMILRATGAFIVLLIMTRLMGRKQLSQLTFFNYITGIALGTIAASMASETNVNYLNGLTSLIWWSFLTILVGYIGLKSSKARVIMDGQPAVVIKQGKVLENELGKLRLDMDDLTMLLREQKIFSIKDVENAVFESNGKLSIMLKEEKKPVTKQDQNIFTVKPKYIPMELIVDGKIVEKNLKEAGVSLDWITNQLSSQNLNLEEVFYVELQKDGTLYVDKRSDNLSN